MASPHDIPDRRLDPPEEERPWCQHCGLDPACDCEPCTCPRCGALGANCWCNVDDNEPEDCPATVRDGELYECDVYAEPFDISGEDEPLAEDR